MGHSLHFRKVWYNGTILIFGDVLMQVLYLLEKLRMPVLNELMLLVTRFGEETAFLVAAIVVFWCVDKRRGYYMLSVGFLGTLANQFLKLVCRVPRPWVRDPNFTILEQAREAASGYSFPSGHSQSAVGTFGAIAYTAKNKWVRNICIAIAILVPFSRMYIGVHFPSDVLVGSGMAMLLIWGMHPIIYKDEGKHIPKLLIVMAALCFAYLAYVELTVFPEDMDAHNLESAVKNAYTLTGCLLGLLIAYYVDEKKLHFCVDAVWWAQLIKVGLGLILVLAVKEGLRGPLDAIFGGHMAARSVRYFLMVIMAGVIWPLSFGKFARMGREDS